MNRRLQADRTTPDCSIDYKQNYSRSEQLFNKSSNFGKTVCNIIMLCFSKLWTIDLAISQGKYIQWEHVLTAGCVSQVWDAGCPITSCVNVTVSSNYHGFDFISTAQLTVTSFFVVTSITNYSKWHQKQDNMWIISQKEIFFIQCCDCMNLIVKPFTTKPIHQF